MGSCPSTYYHICYLYWCLPAMLIPKKVDKMRDDMFPVDFEAQHVYTWECREPKSGAGGCM